MKTLITLSLAAALGAGAALADATGHGNQSQDHNGHAAMMATGMPGKASEVKRTIKVTMKETDDGRMIYTPKKFDFNKGETIRFEVSNKGELQHEFILDTIERNAMHKQAMAQQMEDHQMPNAITLEPGEKGEIIWTFGNPGTFEVACLIPGHYESGMLGEVTVR